MSEKIQVRVGIIEMNYWNIQQKTYQDKVAALADCSKEELISVMLDHHYNSFCRDHADSEDEDGHRLGKRIPYIGWFWRDVLFDSFVPIGEAPSPDNSGRPFIGFMANNKWGYPERYLTEVERLQVLAYLDKAIASYRDKDALGAALRELWDYMQTLNTETTQGWEDAWYDD
jgi:hypothetical protein